MIEAMSLAIGVMGPETYVIPARVSPAIVRV